MTDEEQISPWQHWIDADRDALIRIALKAHEDSEEMLIRKSGRVSLTDHIPLMDSAGSINAGGVLFWRRRIEHRNLTVRVWMEDDS